MTPLIALAWIAFSLPLGVVVGRMLAQRSVASC